MRPLAPVLVSSLLLLAWAEVVLAARPLPAMSPRAAVLSCDGAPAGLVRAMLADGVMPNLAQLRADGVGAAFSRTNFASKTASGHAALWTGTFGDRNGITANIVAKRPLGAHSVLETQSGFEATSLVAEPLFVSAARAGKRVLALNVPQTVPLDVFGPGGRYGLGLGGRLALFSGYESHIEREAVLGGGYPGLPIAMPPGDMTARVIDDPTDPAVGFDTCLIVSASNQVLAKLKPLPPERDAGWSSGLVTRTSKGLRTTYFRLFELSPDGRRVVLYQSPAGSYQHNQPNWSPAQTLVDGGFIDHGAGRVYMAGKLGKTLADGGDGTAEVRYLATIRFALAKMKADMRMLAANRPWDLFLNYIPFPDEAEHGWYGYVTPGSPAYDPALAPRLAPHMKAVFAAVDDYIGAWREAIGPRTTAFVVSDHGMAAARWDFRPNVVLRRAGLLAVTADGQIDLAHTEALYAPTDGAYIIVNTTDRPGGIVPPAKVPAVLAKVRRALAPTRVKSAGGMVPLVRMMLDARDPAARDLGIGRPFGGDLYLDLQPGYYFDAAAAGEATYIERVANASGVHVFDPRRPELHAIFYAAGPGIRRGGPVGGVRNIDLAPTVSRILGIPAPAQATGRVISEALLGR